MAEFTFDGDAFIARLKKIPQNTEVGLKRAGIYLLSQAQKTIKSGGEGWAPFRRPPKPPHNLLLDNGRLIGSLAPNSDENIFDLEHNSITVGSNVEYAAAQNYGFTPRNLPARPFLFIDQERADRCMAIIAKAMFDASGGA